MKVFYMICVFGSQLFWSRQPYRFARLQELLKANIPIDASKAASILRNRKGVGGAELGLANEMAINQFIAHHSVIFQPEKKLMWVSTSPWQCGKYVAYDLNRIFSDSIDFNHEIYTGDLTLPADSFLQQQEYQQLMAYKRLAHLWCHTVSNDPRNAFSFLIPVAQYGRYGAILTLETLGKRWGWEKTKVWRFFQKHGDAFSLHRLPGSFGCLIFNNLYPTDAAVSLPTREEIMCILDEIRICAVNARKHGSDHEHMSRMVAWFSKRVLENLGLITSSESGESRVALSAPIIRAYFSLCWNCKNCGYDCRGASKDPPVMEANHIRGPCWSVDLTKIAKENFIYG